MIFLAIFWKIAAIQIAVDSPRMIKTSLDWFYLIAKIKMFI